MDWEQKLAALKSLTSHHLEMRKPGDWYVSCHAEVAGDGMLRGQCGEGATPQDAVEDHWRLLTELPPDRYLRCGISGHTKVVRWNGFMWEDASHMRRRQVEQKETRQ